MTEILKLHPALKDYIWGGKRLKAEFPTDLDRVAEAWVLACHPDGKSRVTNGQYRGRTLEEALGLLPEGGEAFPFLVKLIDSEAFLSVQVHPDDAYAKKHEGQPGKTEMWYIMDAEDGAGIYYGFKEKITRDAFRRHIEAGTLTEALEFVPVRAGESYFIDAGTIHAIGRGLLIAEIQQNSNVTYRVYDYGRVGADGKPRALHIDKAMAVTKTEPARRRQAQKPHAAAGDGELTLLADCPYFKVQKLSLDGRVTLPLSEKHTALLAVAGAGRLEAAGDFKRYDCFYAPQAVGEVRIIGRCEILIASAD